MTMTETIGYPASLIMGIALGLTGGGGSILTVPIMVYLFGVSALLSTTYSLVIVGLVALWGVWRAKQSGDLNLVAGLSFAIPGALGVALSRKLLVPLLPETLTLGQVHLSKDALLLLAFSILMLLASVSMIRASQSSAQDSQMKSHSKKPLQLFFLGLFVGIIAGFVGAGGGFLIVPALVHFANLEMKKAVGTSLLVISTQSLLGVLGDYKTLLELDIVLLGAVVLLALSGMSIGTIIRDKLPNKILKATFGYFVFFMGIAIFIRELSKGVKL